MISLKHSFKLLSKKDLVNLSNNKGESLVTKKEEPQREEFTEQSDNSKRTFLKVAGIAGAGLVASQLLPKKAEALIMGSTPSSSVVGIKNAANQKINPATQETLATLATETTLASIKTGTDNLAGIKTGTDNLLGIKIATDKFTFDGDNLKVTSVGGSSASDVGIKDSIDKRINPASDDSIVYLRRMVKLMESQATVDAGNRQRITIDSLGTGTAITTTVPVSGTVTVGTISTVTNMTSLAGQNQQMYQDVARNAYANGIRQNLIFS